MKTKKKTFGEVAQEYASASNPEWKRLRPRSKEIYTRGLVHLERFNKVPVADITRPMVIQYRDDMYDYPGKCRVGLTVLNNVLRYAHDRGLVEYNQAQNVRGLPPKKPIERWSDEEVMLFLEKAPAYLKIAVAIAYYTGQRRSDLVRIKWKDYNGDTIKVKQEKTGTKLEIPAHKRLKALLDELIEERKPINMAFMIVNTYGQPMTTLALTKAVRHWANKLGINKSLHGLRKSAAAKLAEVGCTPHQIRSITGHQSLKEVENYTREADQKRLAREAMEAWT